MPRAGNRAKLKPICHKFILILRFVFPRIPGRRYSSPSLLFFTSAYVRAHTCKHATCNDRQRIDDHTTSTIRLLCCQRGIYELVGDLHGENTFVESPTRCVTSAKWARVGTRVGIPRIAVHSTARTFTGYVGPSQGTREHRFLIVSVPDTRRSCHVILHCTEEWGRTGWFPSYSW